MISILSGQYSEGFASSEYWELEPALVDITTDITKVYGYDFKEPRALHSELSLAEVCQVTVTGLELRIIQEQVTGLPMFKDSTEEIWTGDLARYVVSIVPMIRQAQIAYRYSMLPSSDFKA